MNEQRYCSDYLLAGVGRADITPPLDTLLMGYPDPHGQRRAEQVHDPLQATALVFKYGETRAALVSMDLGVIQDAHVADIRRLASAETGIEPHNIAVCTIQTHSSPCTQLIWGWCDLDLDYIERIMIPGAVNAVVDAAKSCLPVRVGIGVTMSEVGVNRRPLDRDHQSFLGQYARGLYDPEMTVLRIESERGTLANLVHYGAHPTVLGAATSKLISRDWPGVMIDRVEHFTGAPTLFFNGAVGDIAPRVLNGGAIGDCANVRPRDPSDPGAAIGDGLDALREVGGRAATDAMRAWRAIKELRDLPLTVLVEDYELPYRPLTPLAEAQRQLAAFESRRDEPGEGMCEYRHWQAVTAAHQSAPQSGKTYRQTILALGPLAIVPFPGEPFAQTVLTLRDLSPFQHTLCVSTACGNNAYFPTLESLPRGGYEPWVGKAMGAYLLAENIADVLVDRNLEMLHRLYGRMDRPWPSDQTC